MTPTLPWSYWMCGHGLAPTKATMRGAVGPHGPAGRLSEALVRSRSASVAPRSVTHEVCPLLAE
jgi:hypothetical protein